MAKILIVDDEKSIRRTLREILEFEKYDISEAEDGQPMKQPQKHLSFRCFAIQQPAG